mgnify:CR=1 FL=1
MSHIWRLMVCAVIFGIFIPLGLAADPNWSSFKDADSKTVSREALRLSGSENEQDRILAAELLDRYPLYFSPGNFLALSKKLIEDHSAKVREQALAALFNVADGGFPSVSQKEQSKLVRNLAIFLELVQGKPGYDKATIGELLLRLKNNPLYKNVLHEESHADKGVNVQ